MSAAPQRPAFVLIWIVAFTILVGIGLGSISPIEASTDAPNEAAYESLPNRIEIGPDDPRATGSYPSHSEPAQASPVSAEYTRPRGGSELQLFGSVLDQNQQPCAGAKVELWLDDHFDQQLASDRAVFTDDWGRFKLPPVAPTGSAVLVARHREVCSKSLKLELQAYAKGEPLALHIDFSTALRLAEPQGAELTASKPEFHAPAFRPQRTATAVANPGDLSVDLTVASSGAMAMGSRPRPEALRMTLLGETAADGSGILLVTALFPPDAYLDLDEDEENDEAVQAALEALPESIQEMLGKAKRSASEYLEDSQRTSSRAKLVDRLREAASRPRVAQMIAKLSPRQMAKARRLLQQELRERM